MSALEQTLQRQEKSS